MEKKNERVTVVAGGHTYEFQILEALYGLGVYHEWVMYLGNNLDKVSSGIKDLLNSEENDGDDLPNVVDFFRGLTSDKESFTILRGVLVKVVSVQKLFELCATFLGGAKIDDEECDDFGMCSIIKRQPHEVYTALILAVAVNYPDYFPFVTKQLATGESRSPE